MKKQNSLTQVVVTSLAYTYGLALLGVSSSLNHDNPNDPYTTGLIDSDDVDLLVELHEIIIGNPEVAHTTLVINDLGNGLTEFEIHYEGGYTIEKDDVNLIKGLLAQELLTAV